MRELFETIHKYPGVTFGLCVFILLALGVIFNRK